MADEREIPIPRTISGKAWVSGLRPHLRRAVALVVVRLEAEAVAPYEAALREADRALELAIARGAVAEVTARAEAARAVARQLLDG
jgi:hypothetical protein